MKNVKNLDKDNEDSDNNMKNINKKSDDNKDDSNIYDYLLKDETGESDKTNIKHEDRSLKIQLKNKKKRDDDDDYGDDCIVFSVKIL